MKLIKIIHSYIVYERFEHGGSTVSKSMKFLGDFIILEC